eukprot:TRINITY_DN1403_c0_g1_i3.p1 TRINITY_DN1403_c0_g1~~TRINITY_DN1403_c0_g1_i3.p1  ORF type:complete len:123 (-),score=13.34 TRINITY_DN1403_c0_g1_i3:59-394(-)
MICARCNHGYEQTYGNGFKNVGFFLTGFFIVSGFALPGLLAHINLIPPQSLFMGLAGGLVVYGTIMVSSNTFLILTLTRHIYIVFTNKTKKYTLLGSICAKQRVLFNCGAI